MLRRGSQRDVTRRFLVRNIIRWSRQARYGSGGCAAGSYTMPLQLDFMRSRDDINLGYSMRVVLTTLPLALATTAGAQTAEIRSYWNLDQHEIRSSVSRLNYRLFVSLPPGYPAKDTTTYPVLYVLDGNDAFPLIQAMRRYLGEGGAIPRVIIVGVGYPDSANANTRRTMVLTPSPNGDPTSRLP